MLFVLTIVLYHFLYELVKSNQEQGLQISLNKKYICIVYTGPELATLHLDSILLFLTSYSPQHSCCSFSENVIFFFFLENKRYDYAFLLWLPHRPWTNLSCCWIDSPVAFITALTVDSFVAIGNHTVLCLQVRHCSLRYNNSWGLLGAAFLSNLVHLKQDQ